ncbi:hypothetical protein EDL99_11140 [Ornithobacterium rhinotracheale]|uniref:hypothetical protein n=1 Tax=Ornithobacterium rhinotracheale TaxID=28251 RepID=UPI00129C7427|nr:hypothetical protein [Ornithobacterium rhinotracheale]MRJ09406.1 hypothetical protein [Ornithobacterium rhinotracheale]UOH78751.1 hypothetical protein MT996_04580 [Ornithobacterium rhinotracheale]
MDQLIKQCRYYKGEKENPFQEDNHKNLFWHYEKKWVEFSLNPREKSYLEGITSEYKKIGLTTFNENDGIPITLKALLLSRFLYWNEGADADLFKEWYKKYYLS